MFGINKDVFYEIFKLLKDPTCSKLQILWSEWPFCAKNWKVVGHNPTLAPSTSTFQFSLCYGIIKS